MTMTTIPMTGVMDHEMKQLPSYVEVLTNEATSKNPTHLNEEQKICIFVTASICVVNANSLVRLRFLQKVFGILSSQLLVFCSVCIAVYTTPGIQQFLIEQLWIAKGSFIVSILLLFPLFIYAKHVPANYILLGLFTITQSITVSLFVSLFNLNIILEAVLLTSIVAVWLFVHVLTSVHDFEKHRALLSTLTVIMMASSFMRIFLQWPTLNLLIAVPSAVIFSMYVILDMDYLMHHCSPEEYIYASVSLYLDVIHIFVRIIRLTVEVKRN